MERFSARVLSCVPLDAGQYEIVLDRTAFFPEQGGQTADTGTLGAVRVLDAHLREGTVRHLCDGPLGEGSQVEGRLDFAHRFSHMQQHTGEHILSGRCAHMYGCRNVGFHLSDHVVTVDYDKPLTPDQLDTLETEANRAVWANLPVRCWFPTADEAAALDYRSKKEIMDHLRIVSIPGVDDCACCAPHVRATGEVGLIKIMSAIRYKGGVRLSILCGERALAAVRQKQRCLDALARQMTCGEEELPQVLMKRDADLKDMRQRLAQAEAALLLQAAEEARKAGQPTLRTEQADMQAMIRAAAVLAADGRSPIGVFAGTDGAGYSFCLMGDGGLTAFFDGFRQRCGARGGGDGQLIRGRCAGSWAEISACFQ